MAGGDEGAPRGDRGTQALTRAVSILRLAAGGPVTLPQIVEATGLTQTTAYRIASALVECGLLARSGRTGYTIGPLVHDLSHRGAAARRD